MQECVPRECQHFLNTLATDSLCDSCKNRLNCDDYMEFDLLGGGEKDKIKKFEVIVCECTGFEEIK
jgi:hypothetical protein